MNFKEISGVVALVILAIMGLSHIFGSSTHLAGSTSCANITCLAGGLRLVTDLGGTFESDVAATLASAVITAGETVGTTLKVAGQLSVATTSPSTMGDVVVESTGTSTLMLSSSSATKGSCLQMENSVGALTRVYILGTTFVLEAGSCK